MRQAFAAVSFLLVVLSAVRGGLNVEKEAAEIEQKSVFCVLSERNDNSSCPPSSVHNDLFGFISNGVFNRSNVSFVFMPGNHSLNTTLVVDRSTHLSLRGSTSREDDLSATIECTEMWHIGFVFVHVSDLHLKDLNFVNCTRGTVTPNVRNNGTVVIVSALFFQGGKDLEILRVNLTNSALFFNNTLGNVSLSKVITESYLYQIVRKTHYYKIIESLGGSYFNFSSCGKSDSVNLSVSDSTFEFHNKKEVLVPFNQSNVKSVDRLQGVTLTLYCTNVRVKFTRSRFLGFMGTNDGGNMALILQNNTHAYEHPIEFHRCRFEKGHAKKGGGIYISLVQTFSNNTHELASDVYSSENKTVIFNETIFYANSAEYSGAAVCIMQKQSYSSKLMLNTLFCNCNFSYNYLHKRYGHGGIAIHILEFIAITYRRHSAPQYNTSVQHCSFHDNYVRGLDHCAAGSGVITVIRNSLFTLLDSDIDFNNCTAILSVGTSLLLGGNVNIHGNKGSSGGGLMFCSETIMFLMPYTHVRITDNSVLHAGGGICVDSLCLQSKPMCFFQFTDEINNNVTLIDTITVELFNNQAPHYAGHNLFGGFVDRCFMLDTPSENSPIIFVKEAFQKVFDVENVTSSITSIPMKVCFCNDDQTFDCDKDRHSAQGKYPGQPVTVSVIIVGQLDGAVPGSIRTAGHGRDMIRDEEQLQKVPHTQCSDITYTVKSNASNVTIEVHVDHDGDISAYLQSGLFPFSYINVELEDCPVGFAVSCVPGNESECTCDCNPVVDGLNEVRTGHVKCSIADRTITKHSLGWIGYVRDPYNEQDTEKYFVTHRTCPYDYCWYHAVFKSTNNSLVPDDIDPQCRYGRTGILCGSCPGNLSVILGTSECSECSNNFLSLIIVFALMGVLLIGFLSVCNFTVSEGTISGLLFYANAVQIGATNLFSTDRSVVGRVLRIFISWINLDFGITVCFYNGMDAYAKAWFQFVFPLYLWILSGIIVFLCSRYISVTRLFGRNSIKVLSTLILLSFTKLVRAVLTTVSYVRLNFPRTLSNTSRQLWLSDPSVLFLQSKHIPLFIAGLVFIVFHTFYISYLLLIQCLQRFRFVQRLKPFTDCYTGPNTSNGRFWTGLLLVSRFALVIAEVFNSGSVPQIYVKTTIGVSVSLLFILVSTPTGIYTQHKHNILESFFLLNLSALCLGVISTGSDDTKARHHIFHVSCGASFLVFLGLLVYHSVKQIRGTRCWASVKQFASTKNIRLPRRLQRLQSFNNVEESMGIPSPMDRDRSLEENQPLLNSCRSLSASPDTY